LTPHKISNKILAEAIEKAQGVYSHTHRVSVRAATFEEIEHILSTEPIPGDVIMTMGAGDIYKVADNLVRS
jgi:UDP-N-acetylmuramate-alanine ligase